MKRKKFYLGLILFILGMLGMLSMLTVDIPLPEEILSVLEDQFSPFQIKLLILINPIIILIVAVIVGTLLYQKVFGWLFWKKGLESAFLAHIFAHVAMVITEKIL